MRRARKAEAGFSLIQISILLTVAGLLMVAVLPSPQATVQKNAGGVTKMNAVLTALRQYQAATCTLPCPADPTQPIGAANYGKAATNNGTTGNCVGGSPAAAYADTTNHIAIGMVPIYTIGLSYDYALDSWGRNITYAVDTNATAANWSSLSLPGAITVNDYGNIHNSVVALVSHGQDGYGAWLPLQGTSGTAPRFNNGSTDTSQANNAQVAPGGGLTANTTFASFINQAATSTFDDNVVYSTSQWNMNAVPHIDQTTVSPPANGTYSAPQTLTFTITSPQILTVTGTPQLDLSALAGGSIGSSNKAYATYASGSGSNTLTFTYQIQSSDNAPNGLSMTAPVDLNGGTIFPCLPFNAPDLSQVKISNGNLWVADYCNNRAMKLTTGGTFVAGYGAGYNGAGGSAGNSGSSNLKLHYPSSIVTDNSGNVWILDTGNNRVVEYTSTGAWNMTIGGVYNQAAPGCAGTYVTSTTCNPLPASTNGTSRLAGTATSCCAPNATSCSCSKGAGAGEFSLSEGGVMLPGQLAFDASGNLWVTDFNNNRVQEFNASTGAFMQSVTVPGTPSGLAFDGSGNIWVALPSSSNGKIAECLAPNFTTCNSYGSGVMYSGNGGEDSDYVSIDSSSNIWVSDQSNNVVREFSGTTGAHIGDLNNTNYNMSEGNFNGSGYVWVSDNNANNVVKINISNGAILTTIGTGSSGTGTSPVQFNCPQSIYINSR